MEDLARYYDTLEVDLNASPEEIRQAYLDLVKIWHPDLYHRESERLREKAAEKLKAINEAYEKLRSGRNKTCASSANAYSSHTAARPSAPRDDDVKPIEVGPNAWGYVDKTGSS